MLTVLLAAIPALLTGPPPAQAAIDAVPGRIAGASRMETATEVSRYQFPDGADEVYLARSDVFADAVAAGPLDRGPTLLVPACGTLPTGVAAEIARLEPERVIALGGPAAVCTDILTRAGSGRAIRRLAGDTRVGTAVEISRYRFPRGADEVYLARSDVFADAVAAGPLDRGPVLLVPACGGVPTAVAAEIARLDPDRVTALGGPVAVCDDVLAEAADARERGRLAGSSRIETAVAVARDRFPDGADEVYLTRRDVFADAVAAGPLDRGPTLLVPACGGVPPAVERELDRLDPDRVIGLGGASAVCADLLREATGQPFEQCTLADVTPMGTASQAAPVVAGTLVGGTNYVVTRGVVPPQLGAFDVDRGIIRDVAHLSSGRGAWASTADAGGDLYVGTYTPADLYHVDTADLGVRRVARFPDAHSVASVTTAPDGTVFVGTLPDGAVYEYNPDSRAVRSRGVAQRGEYAVRSIAATRDTIFAGVGSHAQLVAIDRDTGSRRDVLPAALEGESFVYTLAISDEWLAAGTEPSGRLALLRVDDPAEHRLLPDLGERTIDAIAIHGDDVYFTGRTTGAVYHHDIASGSSRKLGVPIPAEETRALSVRGRTLVGTAGSGAVWRLHLDTGDVDVVDLVTAGLPGGPEPVQSLAALGPTVAVGGHWGIQVHGGGGVASRRVRVPGEPKAMVEADGALLAAIYPGGEVWRYQPGRTDATQVARIGHQQARPRGLAVDPGARRVFVTTQSDYGVRGGALSVLDANGRLAVHRDVVPDHSVDAVAPAGQVVYVGTELAGGGGTPPATGPARVAAWDVAGARRLWDTPIPGAAAVLDLVTLRGTIYGLTADGTVFGLDPSSRRLGRRVDVGSGRALVLHDGALLATSSTGLFRIDPVTFSTRPVLRGSGFRHLAAGRGCRVYVARDTQLLALDG